MNPFIYGPAGYVAGLPIVVQAVSDIAEAKTRAFSTVVESVADALAAWTGTVAQSSSAFQYPQPGWRYPDVRPPQPRTVGDTVGVTSKSRPSRQTTVHLVEGDESYLAHVEIPSVEPEDISVRIERNHLEVSGKPRVDGGMAAIFASLPIPQGVDRDNIAAEYRDGILEVRLPKESNQIRRDIKVQTGAMGKPVSPKT